MTSLVRGLGAAVSLLILTSCSAPSSPPVSAASVPPAAAPPNLRREVRATCLIQAVNAVKVTVPRIEGQTSMMTLTHLIQSGERVEEGDVVATLDASTQIDVAREAQAKFEDLGHQAEQKAAEIRANREKRTAELRQAEADLAKAELELSKSAILSDIDVKKNQTRAGGARAHLESLQKSMAYREKSEAASLRVLELQGERQKVAMQRATDNIQKLEVRAPQAGTIVHEMTYRSGSYGPAQVGDQLYRGYPLISIFDPGEMRARCSVNEPDIQALQNASEAFVIMDSYPEARLPARFIHASPVASSPLGTPIKSFVAVFRIEKPDSRLVPDMSAAVVLAVHPAGVAK